MPLNHFNQVNVINVFWGFVKIRHLWRWIIATVAKRELETCLIFIAPSNGFLICNLQISLKEDRIRICIEMSLFWSFIHCTFITIVPVCLTGFNQPKKGYLMYIVTRHSSLDGAKLWFKFISLRNLFYKIQKYIWYLEGR